MTGKTRATIGELCTVVAGGTPARSNPKHFGGTIPWIKIGDMLHGCITHTEEYITELAIKNSSAKILPVGTVIVSIFATIGRTAVLGVEAATNQAIAGLTPRNSDQLSAAYLRRYLDSVVRELESKAQGVAQVNINSSVLKALKIPLPPIGEQSRILGILDSADALRAKRRKAIALLDDLTQSIFLDMFGDRREICSRWPTEKLGKLLDFLTSGSRGWAAHYVDEPGSLFLRIQNVRRNELLLQDVAYVKPPDTAEARRTRVQPGDVLLSITADLGRTAVVPTGIGEAFINQHLSILRCRNLKPDFLSAYLSSPSGQEKIMGRNRQAVKAGLNFDDVRSLVTPCPPRELQDDFSRRLASTRELQNIQRIHLAELDALFSSLQHRALRGELWAGSPAA